MHSKPLCTDSEKGTKSLSLTRPDSTVEKVTGLLVYVAHTHKYRQLNTSHMQ